MLPGYGHGGILVRVDLRFLIPRPGKHRANMWTPIVLLLCSNLFMTVAWYGHLRFKQQPLPTVILVSWGIALFEYILMVPANRWGSAFYSAAQLKVIQEVLTLLVFSGFATFYLGEELRWNHGVAFFCILLAVGFTFVPGVPK